MVDTQSETTLHCWKCSEFGYTKNNSNCPLNPKKTNQGEKSKKKAKVTKKEETKKEEKTTKKHIKCTNCGRLNHLEENYNLLYPKKTSVSEMEKALEAKIIAVETKF